MPPKPTPPPSASRPSPPTFASWRQADWCRSRSRSATSRSMRCACWPPPGQRCIAPASPIRGACRAVSLGLGRARAAVARSLVRRPHRRAAEILRRPFVRRLLVSGHQRRRRARRHLQRPAGGLLRQRRGAVGRWPGRLHRRRGRRGACRRRNALRCGLQPGAGDAGPTVFLRRAATGPARHLAAPAGDPAAGGDRRAGEPGGAGAGGGDRRAGAAGAAGGAAPAACRPRRAAARRDLFPRTGSRLPVHRDRTDRACQLLAE